jgi:translation initiation factor 3 subunit H
LVALKIIKFARENRPLEGSGFSPGGVLLGLAVRNRLEVTNCFQTLGDLDESKMEEHQEAMLKALRKVNVDDNTVGWFMASSLNMANIDHMIEAQYSHQVALPNSVVVCLDTYRPGSGRLGLRAYRLTESFMKVFQGSDFTQTGFSRFGVESTDILEEVRVQVHNSHLVHAFLYELRESKVMSTDHTRLGIRVNDFAEQKLKELSASIDLYTQEQGKYHFYERQVARQKQAQQQWLQKRATENEIRQKSGKPALPDDRNKNPLFKPHPKPNRLDTFLVANRITASANEIFTDCSQGFSKLYVVDALQR